MQRTVRSLSFSVILATLIFHTASAQPVYDLLLKGGHVLDAKNQIDAVRDVAITGGKIAAIAAAIPAELARRVVDVAGLYVTPGLVDIHFHACAGTMAAEYTGADSVRPDGFTFRSGVTTVVDAGSSGWRNFPEFKRDIVDTAQTRVLAMLNIVGRGMGGRDTVEQDTSDMDPKRTAEEVAKHPDTIVGIKIAHYNGPEWIAVERAVEAGRLAGVPVMVDFARFRPERPFQDLVLNKLRPGDIYTHTYLGAVPMLDEEGKVLPYLFEAQKRGVIFDVGHGAGSFLFRQAVPAVRQGFLPNSISTDMHTHSMNAGMKDMLNVMSKFLNMGVPLKDVVQKSAWNPAREIHREDLGHLTAGGLADIAVLRMITGDFGFVDSSRRRLQGSQKLVAEMTIRDGKVVWDLNGLASDDWTETASRPRAANKK
jgi:dihydroorotase